MCRQYITPCDRHWLGVFEHQQNETIKTVHKSHGTCRWEPFHVNWNGIFGFGVLLTKEYCHWSGFCIVYFIFHIRRYMFSFDCFFCYCNLVSCNFASISTHTHTHGTWTFHWQLLFFFFSSRWCLCVLSSFCISIDSKLWHRIGLSEKERKIVTFCDINHCLVFHRAIFPWENPQNVQHS